MGMEGNGNGGHDIARPPARLVLPGRPAAAASIEISYQPPGKRLARAVLVLLGSWVLTPLVFFIPPHLPWVLAAIFGGLYLAWRLWRGDYIVREFNGACPRCGAELELKPGTRIRGRETLDCYECHRRPDLVLDEPGD